MEEIENGWILARKSSNSGSLEYKTDGNINNRESKLTEEIVIPLVSKNVDVPSISSSSEISIYHLDNGSISIAGGSRVEGKSVIKISVDDC